MVSTCEPTVLISILAQSITVLKQRLYSCLLFNNQLMLIILKVVHHNYSHSKRPNEPISPNLQQKQAAVLAKILW